MSLFTQETLQHEQLPDQIAQNALIQGWFANDTGVLTWLRIEGSARSADEEDRMWMHIGGSFLISLIAGLIGQAQLANAGIDLSGLILFAALFLIWPFWVWRIVRNATGERVFWIDTHTVWIDRLGARESYVLDQVVGVTLSPIDQQKQDDERWKKLKNRKPNSKERPKLRQPYSRKIDLQTELGCVPLGAIYGVEKAETIAAAINTGLNYMRGRNPTGRQAAVDARFQYATKQAGRIPE
ncbi:hypothetical protein GH722_04875 [Alphaproteobacteria bacterium HT1-32]|nr:hypothetical protein [Alphaproteobacteria bacterium HT1-32]